MGRAIDQEKRIDDLEIRVNEILLILDELGKTGSKQKQVDLHEEIKTEKTNDEGSGDSDVKPNNGNKKKSNRNTKNSKSSK